MEYSNATESDPARRPCVCRGSSAGLIFLGTVLAVTWLIDRVYPAPNYVPFGETIWMVDSASGDLVRRDIMLDGKLQVYSKGPPRRDHSD